MAKILGFTDSVFGALSDLLPAEVAGKEVLDVYELVFMVVGSEQKEGDKNTL